MDILFFVLSSAVVVWIVIIKPWRIMAVSPDRDLSRIKRDYEGQGREIVAVRRAGMELSGRASPAYRKYVVTVRRHDGQTAEFTVGVAFGFSTDAELKEYDPKARKAFFKGSQTFF